VRLRIRAAGKQPLLGDCRGEDEVRMSAASGKRSVPAGPDMRTLSALRSTRFAGTRLRRSPNESAPTMNPTPGEGSTPSTAPNYFAYSMIWP